MIASSFSSMKMMDITYMLDVALISSPCSIKFWTRESHTTPRHVRHLLTSLPHRSTFVDNDGVVTLPQDLQIMVEIVNDTLLAMYWLWIFQFSWDAPFSFKFIIYSFDHFSHQMSGFSYCDDMLFAIVAIDKKDLDSWSASAFCHIWLLLGYLAQRYSFTTLLRCTIVHSRSQ